MVFTAIFAAFALARTSTVDPVSPQGSNVRNGIDRSDEQILKMGYGRFYDYYRNHISAWKPWIGATEAYEACQSRAIDREVGRLPSTIRLGYKLIFRDIDHWQSHATDLCRVTGIGGGRLNTIAVLSHASMVDAYFDLVSRPKSRNRNKRARRYVNKVFERVIVLANAVCEHNAAMSKPLISGDLRWSIIAKRFKSDAGRIGHLLKRIPDRAALRISSYLEAELGTLRDMFGPIGPLGPPRDSSSLGN